MAGIQDIFSSNWITPAAEADRSKIANRKIDKAKGMNVKMAEIHLMAREDRPGIKATRIAPSAGKNIIVVR